MYISGSVFTCIKTKPLDKVQDGWMEDLIYHSLWKNKWSGTDDFYFSLFVCFNLVHVTNVSVQTFLSVKLWTKKTRNTDTFYAVWFKFTWYRTFENIEWNLPVQFPKYFKTRKINSRLCLISSTLQVIHNRIILSIDSTV